MRRKKSRTEDSMLMNNSTYLQYYNRLLGLGISMFEWKNLPSTIDARFLELTLFTKGYAVFFKDEVMGYLALMTTINGKWNVYNIPKQRRAYATNGYQCKLDDTDSVIIYDNVLHNCGLMDLQNYAKRLYNIERTIDVNVNAQKTPVVISCSETQRLSMLNLYEEYDGNEPFIFGDKNLDLKDIQALRTDAPFVADKLEQLKNQIYNEALTWLGISNVSIQKKERLVTDEVVRSMGGTVAQQYTRLNMRQQACEKINEMFGLDISVDYKDTIKDFTSQNLESEDIQNE